MSTDSALYQFFNKFGIPAYPETAVPDNAQMPYITYSYSETAFDAGDAYITVNVWFKAESELIPTTKAREIVDAVGYSGCIVKHDDGYIWLKQGTPLIQKIADEDNTVKRRLINLNAEFF